MASSVVSVVAPILPRHPIFEGKFIYPSDSLFRSPCRPHRDSASKVSRLDLQRSTDVYRFDFDTPALTPGSIDPIGMVRGVPVWLRRAGAL